MVPPFANIYNLYQAKIEFFPFKDDWLIIKFGNAFKDSFLEFLFGTHPDMAGSRYFCERFFRASC